MFEDLKMPVGRPLEAIERKQDLTGYMVSAKFKKQVTKFFKYWDRVVANKAKKNSFLVHNMENFYGEILDKFEELSEEQQLNIFNVEKPFKLISESTNLKLPTVFNSKEDNRDFIEIFLNHKF